MHLFEGGILDKMTTAEYEIQSHIFSQEKKAGKSTDDTLESAHISSTSENFESNSFETNSGESKTGNDVKSNTQNTNSEAIQPLNLRMLQGAFIVLIVGYTAAGNT